MEIKKTKDYEKIALLNKHVHDLHVSLYPNYFKEYEEGSMKDFFKTVVTFPNHYFLLLEDQGETKGYAWVERINQPEDMFRKAYQCLYVHQISINPTNQNQGYGRRLMKAIYNLARRQGIKRVELEYWIGNDVARAFYKKEDFKSYREVVYKEVD
ncbi:GNAT family N-acetyltransferase [Oceanobacillus halotolerans]|uniref:GNAT family N-acetyltransferase n=1 Tax=Oceanobacillus halotolerans TaxID=2663380 RepID=UPI0013DBF2FA|nr:GNAT family N-acetyltransferase [Oceanobacillus halotolerans]